MSTHYRVGRHSSLRFRTGIAKSGTLIAKDDALDYMGQKEIDRLRGMGVLVDADQQYESPDDPNINQKPLPAEVDLTKTEMMHTTDRLTVRTPTDPAQTPARHEAWTIDPENLQGKDINELNVMISERTFPGKPPETFETPEEAIAWLSQDFIAADAPQITAP